LQFSIASITFLLASLDASPLFILAIQFSNTSLKDEASGIDINSCISSFILFLICLTPRYIPYPNSALSSNKEFAQAGPLPSWFTVYGVVGADPPHIDEHPVAFAIIILSPYN